MTKTDAAHKKADSHFKIGKRRTDTVKDQLAAEATARDANTARLRALRLEAADSTAQ
jgi:hypothetical protein